MDTTLYEQMIRDGQRVGLMGSMSDHLHIIGPLVSWFANDRERKGIDWKVAILCPRHDWAIGNFRYILNHYPLPGDTAQKHAIHARHGSVQVIFDQERRLPAIYARNLLWVVESHTHSIWDFIMSQMDEGVQIIGFEPPLRYWPAFANLKEIMSNINTG